MLIFNELLQKVGIEPGNAILMRHSPTDSMSMPILLSLANDRPEIFNAFQQTQKEREQGQLQRAGYVASFIGQKPGSATFVGLYKNAGSRVVKADDYWNVPGHAALKGLGMTGPGQNDSLIFDLQLLPALSQWKGKLIIEWSIPARPWVRLAPNNPFEVQAILEESLLAKAMPAWDELVVTWPQLASNSLPTSWQDELRRLRGVYFIYDRADGKGYVGSAYGAENILGRWQHYGATGHGDNKWLLDRNPDQFEFSILELAGRFDDLDSVIEMERKWKLRLHTRHPEGLNGN